MHKQRKARGAYTCLNKEFCQKDPSSYKNFLGMNPGTFFEIPNLVKPLISKQVINIRARFSAS